MNISYYTAISAMNAFQSELDVTANNMANVSTPGYKVLRSSFDDLPIRRWIRETQTRRWATV